MIVVDDPESAPGLPAAPLPPQEIDEGEGQEEDGQAQQHAGKKQKSGGWPLCGDAQEAYMRKLRERIDIGQRQAFLEIEGVASSGWIATPPHPYLGAGCGSLPDKELFYLQPVADASLLQVRPERLGPHLGMGTEPAARREPPPPLVH